jgi:hypothetical protein
MTAATLVDENESIQPLQQPFIEDERNKTRRANFFLTWLQEKANQSTPYDDLVDAPASQDSGVVEPALV